MNDLIPEIPSHLSQYVGKESSLSKSIATSTNTGGGESLPRISIKGSRFRLIVDGEETLIPDPMIQVIIVGANPKLSKSWYAKPWTPDSEPQAPDCYSLDGIKPHMDSAQPQNDLCASCDKNAWGSKITPQGQKIKACADQKRLAVIDAGNPNGEIFLLQVTPSALKELNNYHSTLSSKRIPFEIVKTNVSFDSSASYPKLKFGFGGFIDAEPQQAVDKLFNSRRVKEITGEEPPITEVPKEEPEQPLLPLEEEPKAGFSTPTKESKPVTPPVTAAAEPTDTPKPVADTGMSSDIEALMKNMENDDGKDSV